MGVQGLYIHVHCKVQSDLSTGFYLSRVGGWQVGGFWENPHELNATVWKAIGDKFDAEELEPQRRKKQERREHPLPASFSESGFDVEGMTMRESEILMGVIEPSFTELSSFSGSRMARVAARARGAIPLASTRDQMPEGNTLPPCSQCTPAPELWQSRSLGNCERRL